jgi:hypothetical protein
LHSAEHLLLVCVFLLLAAIRFSGWQFFVVIGWGVEIINP